MLDNLLDVFRKLRSDSIAYSGHASELMQKYGMVFVDTDCKTIYAEHLYLLLEKQFNITISREDFNNYIPQICEILSLKYEPLRNATDPNSSVPYSYQITLK